MKLSLISAPQAAQISCLFIDHYMTACPPVYSLIYIFCTKKLQCNEAICISDLAKQFNLTQSDVYNAWLHWQEQGLVKLTGNLENDFSVEFLPISTPEIANANEVAEPKVPVPIPLKPTASRPQYSPEELALYRQESREIARLCTVTEQTLGKMLNFNDLSVVFGFHDWLHLPVDVIEYLLNYCAENGHRNLRYIEKCALDWSDNEIFDLETAINYVSSFDKNYRTILHYMGQSGYPTPSHRKYIDKWLELWQMPLDIIMEACDRCVAELNKPKFNYIDKILQNWSKKGIRDIQAIKAEEEAFSKEKEQSAFAPVKAARANRFINFPQRENDHTRREQLERAYLEQSLVNAK